MPIILNSSLISWLNKNYKNMILAGDLNSKSQFFNCKRTNSNGEILNDILTSNNLLILNTNFDKTFHILKSNPEKDYHEFLDVLIGSPVIATKTEKYEVIESPLLYSCTPKQYHSAIQLEIDLEGETAINNQNKEQFYAFNKANWSTFKEELAKCDLLDIENISIDNLSNIIHGKINKEIENSVPKQTNKLPKMKILLPNEILSLITKRNRLRRIFTSSRKNEDKILFQQAASEVKLKIVELKSMSWQTFVNNIGPRPWSSKPYWKRINELRNKRKPKNMPTIIHKEVSLTSDESKAKAFKDKLKSTFNEDKNYSRNFNEFQKAFVEDYIVNRKFSDLYTDKSYAKVTLDELKASIKKTNTKTTLDEKGISNRVLHKLPENFLNYIVALFNKCLDKNSLPDGWKDSTITMLHKKESTSNINNYRPISSTLCMVRLFEKIIYTRLYNYLNDNNILVAEQSGFRAKRQTKDNLFFITQKSLEALKKREKACFISFDIEGAFDRVWHHGFLFKLAKIRVPYYILIWIEFFLKDRRFCVKVGNFKTEFVLITNGVPQGAVLSPLLFNIFINDVPLFNRPPNAYSVIFADDLGYLFIFKKISSEVESTINEQLNKLYLWTLKWRLKLAPTKCSYAIFSKNYKAGEKGKKGYNNEKLELKLGNETINQDNNPKFLGIYFDKYLSFKNQIAYVRKSCNNRLNILKVLSHRSFGINSSTLINIYKALIRSLIDYSLFMYPIISNTNRKKLQSVQNNALKVIFKKSWDYDASILQRNTNLETIQERASTLITNYIVNCRMSKNPLHEKLVKDYPKNFGRNHNPNIKTLLDPF